MAYAVDEDFTKQLYSGDSKFRATLVINGNTIPNDQIASISISSPLLDDSKQVFYIGNFVSQKLTIKFKNMNGIEVESGQEVSLSIGQYSLIDDLWEDIPIGAFLIDDLAENYYEKCEITCLDYAVKFKPNIDYSECFVDGKATIQTILQYLCTSFNVILGDYPSINNNVEIGTYDSTISGKQWISYIAELKGCNAKMDRAGRLTLQPIIQASNVPINALESAELVIGEKYKISKVVYFDAIRNFTYGDDEDNTLYIRQDNPFVTDTTVIENIYNAVDGFEAYNLKCRNFGDFTLDAWDIIEYSVGNDIYKTWNNNTLTYSMSIMSTVDTKIPTKQQEVTTNVVGGDDSVNIKKIKTEVDSLDATATILAQQTESNATQISRLRVDVNSIQNLFTLTGGNNLIRNSAFLLKDEVWGFTNNGNHPYHTELGNSFNVDLTGKTISIAEIKLQDTIAKTTIDNITGLKTDGTQYTLNFYYKQDDDTTTTISMYDKNNNTVKAFPDITFTDATAFTSYDVSFVPTSSDYVLEINTSTTVANGCFYIYDLMLNSGDIQPWQPASDEVYSTTLKMSRLGLQVYSVGDGTITILGSDGLVSYETSDGKTLGDLVSKRTVDGDKTRSTETQSIKLNNDITNNNINSWVETTIVLNNRLDRIVYLEESGE